MSGRICWLLLLGVAAYCLGVDSFMVAAAEPEKFTRARLRMVEEQLKSRDRGITNEGVLRAMGSVPRHEFVPERLQDDAYQDNPLPIGYGQTISQPYIVAFMTEQLAPLPTSRVLEVGTGSGYQAAVLAQLVKEVYSIEIVEPLADRAVADLKRVGCTNVFVRKGDGYQGWPEAAPFDAIIVTCAPEKVPQPLVDQLRDGGRMIIPVGPLYDQRLYLLEKRANKVERRAVLPVRFVPMTGRPR
jgi:protein-L-isoaspartate(D-aspartate) O-methyltransferase